MTDCAFCAGATDGGSLCDDCRNTIDKEMKRSYVGGDVAKLVFIAQETGLNPERLLADAVRRERDETRQRDLAEHGIEFIPGKPSPQLLRAMKRATLEGYVEAKAQGRKVAARHARKSYGSPAAFRKALSRRKRDITGDTGETSQEADERGAAKPSSAGDPPGSKRKL